MIQQRTSAARQASSCDGKVSAAWEGRRLSRLAVEPPQARHAPVHADRSLVRISICHVGRAASATSIKIAPPPAFTSTGACATEVWHNIKCNLIGGNALSFVGGAHRICCSLGGIVKQQSTWRVTEQAREASGSLRWKNGTKDFLEHVSSANVPLAWRWFREVAWACCRQSGLIRYNLTLQLHHVPSTQQFEDASFGICFQNSHHRNSCTTKPNIWES